jgi:cytoskeletal protein CcmA (bactofilin family)
MELPNIKESLSSEIEIEGSILFRNELTLDCSVRGEIISKGQLTVGANANINGEIATRSIVVYGTVDGNITVEDSCELKGCATLNGRLKAIRLRVEEGAIVRGRVEINPKR